MLLEMIAGAFGDRLAIGSLADGITYAQLFDRAAAGAALIRSRGAKHVAYIGPSDAAFPVALFACAWAGVPLIPLNYRLSQEQLAALLAKHDDTLVIGDGGISVDEWDELTAVEGAAVST